MKVIKNPWINFNGSPNVTKHLFRQVEIDSLSLHLMFLVDRDQNDNSYLYLGGEWLPFRQFQICLSLCSDFKDP